MCYKETIAGIVPAIVSLEIAMSQKERNTTLVPLLSTIGVIILAVLNTQVNQAEAKFLITMTATMVGVIIGNHLLSPSVGFYRKTTHQEKAEAAYTEALRIALANGCSITRIYDAVEGLGIQMQDLSGCLMPDWIMYSDHPDYYLFRDLRNQPSVYMRVIVQFTCSEHPIQAEYETLVAAYLRVKYPVVTEESSLQKSYS